MKRYALAAFLLVISAAATAETLKETATKMNVAASRAVMRRDMKAFDAAFHPHVTADFKSIDHGKASTYAEWLAQLTQSLSSLQHISSANAKLLSCKENGLNGVTSTSFSFTATVAGGDKKIHKLSGVSTGTDSWVKVGGKWKMKKSTAGTQKMTLDGKPFGTGAPQRK